MARSAPRKTMSVRYSEHKIILIGKSGKEYEIKPILLTGKRFEFWYMHTHFIFLHNTSGYEVQDKLGVPIPEFSLSDEVYLLFHAYATMMMKTVFRGYKGNAPTPMMEIPKSLYFQYDIPFL